MARCSVDSGPYSQRNAVHSETPWQAVRLSCAGGGRQAVAQFFPEMGSNLVGLEVDGTEYLYPWAETQGAPTILGTPVLYPTPNRVRNAQFSWGGRTFSFKPNNGTSFIHGLVRDMPWACDEPRVGEGSVSITTRVRFAPGQAIYELYPIRNTLELTYTLTPGAIRLDFRVVNEDQQLLPFGLAIHPYFRIIGGRESVRLQVPAKKWMEAVDLLPTGRLVDLDQAPADLRQPASLAKLDLDDVFWGLEPGGPPVIYYDAIGTKVTLRSSELFTHSVVYTPPTRPFFCVESQSCSTDAHNLHARGLEQEAHLTILKPGEALAAWVEIAVSDQ